jgi:alpha-tubulin suppressor-like RCC1 family protein
MEIRKSSGVLASALLALALLSGCGSSSSTTIPSVATIFYSHTLVFKGYSAMTLGYNGFGQLGQGNLTNLSVATAVRNAGPVTQGATGGEHMLAFGNRTTVMAWGYNLYGQLGNPTVSTTTTSAYSATPVTVHGFNRQIVTSVAAGGYHSLAVAGGKVYSWGNNSDGQLGNNSFVNTNSPVPVIEDPSQSSVTQLGTSEPVVQVAAGGNHSLALTGVGRVWAWGNNAVGSLAATPVSLTSSLFSPIPLLVKIPLVPVPATTPEDLTAALTPLLNVKQIAAAGSTSYALTSDGLTVWAWGYNGLGQLGLDPHVSTNLSRTIPVQINFGSLLGVGVTITKISAGFDHTLALTSDGHVIAWGYNGLGQLGNNNVAISADALDKAVFTPILVLSGGSAIVGSGSPMTGVTDIIAFGNQSMAQVGGHWFGWGDNGFGQLGNPVPSSSISYLLLPSLVQGT